MAIDPKIVDLINADIDSEISAEDQALLDEHLAKNTDARTLRDELSSLCADLDAVEAIPPPTHLKHVILDNISKQNYSETASGGGDWKTMMRTLFGSKVLRHSWSFAAGVILTYTLISSDQISRHAFDDVTRLVGTIGQPEYSGGTSGEDSISLTLDVIAGSVNLNTAGSIMILDFDMTSRGPIEIVADFANRDIWFNGFAQLESNGSTIAAETGQVTMRMEGQRRFAVYLNNASHSAATINLRFFSGGTLIHEAELRFNGAD